MACTGPDSQRQTRRDDVLTTDGLEVYGINWEGLEDARLLQSQEQNNTQDEGFTSWVGQPGPLQNLNEVRLDPPEAPLLEQQVFDLLRAVGFLMGMSDDGSVIQLWSSALALARTMDVRF